MKYAGWRTRDYKVALGRRQAAKDKRAAEKRASQAEKEANLKRAKEIFGAS